MSPRIRHLVASGRDISTVLGLSVWLALGRASTARADVSPLQTVMDGRDEAERSMLTEDGTRTMATSALNSMLYICGALSVVLVVFGLYQLYVVQEEQNMMGTADDRKRAAYWSIVIGSLVSIPAIIAAIVPFNVLGAGG